MAHAAATKRVLIYTLYERLWHWLQAGGILLLLFTGAEIHWAGRIDVFGFDTAVKIHDFLAAVLILNAFLGLFFFVATGNIKHYLPHSRDYFSLALRQGLYYIRGIFRKEPHPFERNTERRLNPIQQLTYIMILNVLIPIQVVTGILMWTSTKYEPFTTLGVIAGLHTLVAWVLLAVIVVHIYMTTTGHTPLEHIRTMLFGWGEVVEVSAGASQASKRLEQSEPAPPLAKTDDEDAAHAATERSGELDVAASDEDAASDRPSEPPSQADSDEPTENESKRKTGRKKGSKRRGA
ncbi:MAG: cytochrome b/b6 domain-containing protein [Myxococcota bacterium]|jgi:thiosulfate reductase cytochrome b subunit|nr:cytochrome b/b6 domain-containing protein [Myxococcota bacterium]